MAGKEPRATSPESLIRELRPIIVALLGSSGVVVLARSDVPERFRVAAETLFWISLVALIASIVAAVYPVVGEPQARWCSNRLTDFWRARVDRRRFQRWTAKWRDYTLLVLSGFDEAPSEWREHQTAYRELRDWFMVNQGLLRPDAVAHIRRHLSRQWDDLTVLEQRLGGNSGIFPFIRNANFEHQMIGMIVESREKWTNGTNRHLSHTFTGAWEGLTDYSILCGWDALEGLRSKDSKDGDVTAPADAEADDPLRAET